MTRAKPCVIVAAGVLVLAACHRVEDDTPPPPPPAPVVAPVAVAPAVAPALAPVEPQPSDDGVIDLTIPEDGDEPAVAPSSARVRFGAPDVRGSLSREVIRRVVARHEGELLSCYREGLRRRPALEGRVAVSFIIAPSGGVQSAAIGSSTVNDPSVEGCVAGAVRRWVFPAPDGGGVVGVSYPFVFSSDAAVRTEASQAPTSAAGGAAIATARACSRLGDNACVIRVLEGRAQTEDELAMLIEAYRARGQTAQAVQHMRTYVERFPDTSRARGYRTIIARST